MFLNVLTSLKIGCSEVYRAGGPVAYSIPCCPSKTSSIADAAESEKIVTAQTATNATTASALVSR